MAQRLVFFIVLLSTLASCGLPPSQGPSRLPSEGRQQGPDAPDADSDGSNA